MYGDFFVACNIENFCCIAILKSFGTKKSIKEGNDEIIIK